MSQMQIAIQQLTAAILGAKGGSVRHLDTDGDGMPDTLYIADNPDPEKAVKVWRFNYEGWAASKTGYNGPFVLGATLDGGIVADFITAGSLDATLIKAGTLDASYIIVKNVSADSIVAGRVKSKDEKTYFDLDDGVFRSSSDVTVTEVSGGALKVYNDQNRVVLGIGTESKHVGNFTLYNTDGSVVVDMYAAGGRLHMSCFDADKNRLVGGPIGFRDINGIKVLALTGF